MRESSFKLTLALPIVCSVCLLCSGPASAQLSARQAAGKQVYLEGRSPSGSPLEAILGNGETRVAGHIMPCGSCHGADGLGRAEGGVAPSNIRWEALMRSSDKTSPLTRPRPRYDAASLRHAIRDAIDPGGNQLGPVMPRYRISSTDLDALIEYLKILGHEPEPGIADDNIRIGAVIPPTGRYNSSFAAVLRAYFDELNQHGGIYGRKLEVVTLQTFGTPAEIGRELEQFVKEQNSFALLAPFPPDSDAARASLLERLGVPAVVTLAGAADGRASESSQVFYILSGLLQQTDALVKFANDHEGHKPPSAVIFPEHRQWLADYILRTTKSLGEPLQFKYREFDAASIAGWLTRQNIHTVFFLGSGRELQQVLKEAVELDIYQPGLLAGQELFASPPKSTEHVFLSFPALPGDVTPEALHEFHLLVSRHGLELSQSVPSLFDLATAKVLTEALRQSGRQLNRAKLVEALTHMHDFNTGLTQAITYDSNRRIGTPGACVVKWDAERKIFAPADGSGALP